MVSSQDRFTNFLRDMKNVHCFLILRVVAASQDLLRFKNQSSITIAIVGPYGWVDGFRYNGSQVIEGNDTVDIASLSDINNWSTGMWWFWNQQATMLAIDQINKDPKILPNTTIKIKRFNNVRINGSQEVFSESLAPQVAQEIATSHPDVVAAMGELFSRTTLYSNEIYSHFQIPFCGATQADVRLFNMENYPFYFQSFPFSSIVNVYQIILKSLNVTQVAFLCRAPLTLSNTFQSTIISSLQQNGIHVAAAIQHTTVSAEFIADVLEAANIRYIILDSSYAAGSFLYYTLAKMKRLVGPKYVWLTANPLHPSVNATALWGPDYFKASKGMIWANVADPFAGTPFSISLNQNFSRRLQMYQQDYGSAFDEFAIINDFNIPQMVDCTYALAIGLDNLMQATNSKPETLLTPAMRPLLNRTLFKNTGYRGLTADPFLLSGNGDSLAASAVYYFDGSGDSTGIPFATTNLEMTKLNYLNASTLIFYDGSSTPPHDGSQSNSAVTLSHSQYGLLWFFFVSGLVISMAFLTLLACFQNYEAVRSGAPTFLIILTFGSTMSFASNLIYIGSISVTTCGVRVWLQLTSYSLMVGSALIKNWRLNHIYNSKVKLKRTSLSLWFWLKAFAVIVFTEQALLIVWVLLAKLRVKNKTISPTQIYRACTAENNVIGYAFWIYNTLLLLGLMRVTYATSHIGHIHSEFSILLISCIVIVLGAILLPSSNDLESSIDALFFQASIIWVGTIVPMTMQLAQRGLSICLDLFNIFEIQVSSKLSNVNPLSRLTQTEPPLPEYQKARSSQLGSRASPKNTIQITGIITCDVVCRMKTAYWSHNWKRGVVAIMRVRSNSYVQFLPARKDLISQPVAYIFNPQKVVVLPLHSSDSTCQMNVNNGRLVLEFLDPAACILFTEQVKTLVSSVQNE